MPQKINPIRFFLTTVGMTLVAQAFHSIGAFVEMGYYKDPQYFPVWSKLMMPTAGPPPASFFLYSLALGFIGWFFFLAVFRVVRDGIPVEDPTVKGLYYGIMIFLAGNLGQSLGMGLIVNLPYGLLFLWTVESMLIYLVNGALAGKWES